MRNRRGVKGTGMDLFSIMFFAALSLVVLILPFINPPESGQDTAPEPQGELIFEMYWPDEASSDVDMWIRDPTGESIGYSNKAGDTLNLLRDDRGRMNDLSERNMEIAYSRGIPDGEYIVNLHMFNLSTGKTPMPVRLVVAHRGKGGRYKQLFGVTRMVEEDRIELTLVRFHMQDGKYVKGSAHNTFQTVKYGVY